MKDKPPVTYLARQDVSVTPFVTVSDKPMTKVEKAVKMLQDNPDWQSKTMRELESFSDIDRNTWSKAKARIQ